MKLKMLFASFMMVWMFTITAQKPSEVSGDRAGNGMITKHRVGNGVADTRENDTVSNCIIFKRHRGGNG